MGISGLRQRAITAVYFGAVVIGLIVIHSVTCKMLLLIIVFGSSYEYEKTVKGQASGVFILSAMIGFLAGLVFEFTGYSHFVLFVSIFTGLWLFISLLGKSNVLNHEKYGFLISALYIGVPLGCLSMYLYNLEEYRILLLSILFMIWISDTGAYLVGSQLGRRKLISKISPNKTMEGFGGALLTALLAGILFYYLFDIRSFAWWIMLAFIVWLAGTMGDLSQSGVKRKYGVKDTGRVLPGHGGFWDRFDSFIMVIPYVILLEKVFL